MLTLRPQHSLASLAQALRKAAGEDAYGAGPTSPSREALPRAVSAPRHALPSEDAGLMRFYASTSARPEAERPMLLLHGVHTAASAREVAPLFDAFRQERPVYALDLPGFGASDGEAAQFTPALYERAITQMLRHIHVPGGVDVVALALSAEYVARVAIENPGLVHALALISPTGFTPRSAMSRPERDARSGARAVHHAWQRPYARLMVRMLGSRPGLRLYWRSSFRGKVDPRLVADARTLAAKPGAERAPLAFLRGELFPTGDPLAVYRSVPAPTLIVYGDAQNNEYGNLPSFLRWNTQFKAEHMARGGKVPHFEATQRVAERLKLHFTEAERVAETSMRSEAHNPEPTAHAPK